MNLYAIHLWVWIGDVEHTVEVHVEDTSADGASSQAKKMIRRWLPKKGRKQARFATIDTPCLRRESWPYPAAD